MSLKQYHNFYLDSVHKYIGGDPNVPDWKAYEHLYALELEMIAWSDLPPTFDETFKLPHRRDYGIDLVNSDYTSVCQVKKYEGTCISWTHMCTFNTYASDIMGIRDGNLILATTKSAKINKMGQKLLGKIKLLRNDFKDLIKKYSRKKIIKPRKKKLKIEKRPYLLECFRVINESDEDVVKCQLPCGCGKTYIMLYTIPLTFALLFSQQNSINTFIHCHNILLYNK